MRFRIAALSITILRTRHHCTECRRYAGCHIFYCYAEFHSTECRYAKCHYAEGRRTECLYAECRGTKHRHLSK